MMIGDPFYPADGEAGGPLGRADAAALRAEIRGIATRLDRVEAALRRLRPRPELLTPEQAAILAVWDEVAALRRRLGNTEGGEADEP